MLFISTCRYQEEYQNSKNCHHLPPLLPPPPPPASSPPPPNSHFPPDEKCTNLSDTTRQSQFFNHRTLTSEAKLQCFSRPSLSLSLSTTRPHRRLLTKNTGCTEFHQTLKEPGSSLGASQFVHATSDAPQGVHQVVEDTG